MKSNRKNNKIMKCPYCGRTAVLRDGSYVYGEKSRVDKLYVCSNYPKCNAYVGVIPGTNIPKGTLADSELRNKRIKAHRAFDEIWKNKIMTRNEAYNWMKFQFGLTGEQAHIGNFSDYMCQKLIEESRIIIDNYKKGREQYEIYS